MTTPQSTTRPTTRPTTSPTIQLASRPTIGPASRLGLALIASSALVWSAQASATTAGASDILPTGASIRQPGGQPSRQPGEPVRELRLYDLSQLRLSLPEQTAARATRVVESMCHLISVDAQSLTENIITVLATASEHEQLDRLVSQMAEPYTARYTVEIVAMSIPTVSSIEIGQPVPEVPSDATRLNLMTRGRINTHFEASESIAYIAGWQPVVGTNSVGYEPKIESINFGFVGGMTITPESRGIAVRVDGSLSEGTVVTRELPMQSHGLFEIGLPHILSRSIRIDLSMDLGTLTAVNVVSGFEPDTSIVIAIRVEQTQ